MGDFLAAILPLLGIYGGVAVVLGMVRLLRGWGWQGMWIVLIWPALPMMMTNEAWKDIWMRKYKP